MSLTAKQALTGRDALTRCAVSARAGRVFVSLRTVYHLKGATVMGRRMLHGVMALAFLASVASLVQSSLTRSIPCPDCGTAMTWIDADEPARSDPAWKLLDRYRCDHCEYDAVMAAQIPKR